MEELINYYKDRLKSVRERKNIVTSQFLKGDLSAKERCYKKFINELEVLDLTYSRLHHPSYK